MLGISLTRIGSLCKTCVGIYVASALFIAAFMIWRGRYGALPTLGASVGVPVILFLLFEVWFLVPLPKGPVERMLGY